MDSNRFFVLSAPVYELARAGLDAAFGHPNGKAETCMPPASLAPQFSGNPVAIVLRTQAEWPEVATAIAQLIGSGAATEITAEQFHAAQPAPPLLP